MSTALPTTFTIEVPDAWRVLPLTRDEARAAVHALVEDWSGADLPLQDVRLLRALAGKVAVDAADAGIVFAASYVEVVDDDGPLDDRPLVDDEGYLDPAGPPHVLLSAVVTLSTHLTQEAFGGRQVSVADLLAAFGEDVGGVQSLHAPVAVDLRAGAAVEHEALERFVAPELREPVPIYRLTYHVPSGDGSGIAVLAFRTPCIGLVEEFQPLFRAIAGTLELSGDS